MASSNERKALWFLALVALSGSAVRLWGSRGEAIAPAQAAALQRQLVRVDSTRNAPRGRRTKSSVRDTMPVGVPIVDLDRATTGEIEALPGIGPALARRIVADRDSAGSYGSLEALCRVRGIGPALSEKLRPLVTFTGPRSPLSDECGGASVQSRKSSATRRQKPR